MLFLFCTVCLKYMAKLIKKKKKKKAALSQCSVLFLVLILSFIFILIYNFSFYPSSSSISFFSSYYPSSSSLSMPPCHLPSPLPLFHLRRIRPFPFCCSTDTTQSHATPHILRFQSVSACYHYPKTQIYMTKGHQ